jgi:hypothetical protein
MTATQVIVEVLDVTEAKALEIQQLADTTFDGSKWNEATFTQIVRTAQYVNKAAA